MNQNYSYPINSDWTTDELLTVIKMLNVVEKAYEQGAQREIILTVYRQFKRVVPAKSEEKQLGREFYHQSGYQLYDVVQAAQHSQKSIIRLVRE